MRRPGLRALAAFAMLGAASAGAGPLEDALHQYHLGHWAQARAGLEAVVAHEPANASALHYLGMSLMNLRDLDGSLEALRRAHKLAPDDEDILSDYGAVCLLLADRDSSLSRALEGRDAMERAISIDPADVDACEGLMEFYARAPWPIGDRDRAAALAGQIAAHDAHKGHSAYLLIASIFEKGGQGARAAAARQSAHRLESAPNP